MDESLKHTVLKEKFIELQEACRRSDVAPPSFTVDVVDFGLLRVLALVADDVSSSNELRRIGAFSE